jgi:hypothetical protein
MRNAFGVAVLIGAFVAAALAQTDFHCKLQGSSIVDHRDKVTDYEVAFQNTWGSKPVTVSAHAFVPDSDKPVAGIVFSVSSIEKYDKHTDLLPFARALARAGAASIVVDRPVKWEPLDQQWNLAPTVMHCAGQWLMKNVNLDRERLATAGPDRWRGDEDCGVPQYQCWQGRASMGFGWTGHAESRNTERMTTLEGQIRIADFARRTLNLSEVKPEWLSVDTHERRTSNEVDR